MLLSVYSCDWDWITISHRSMSQVRPICHFQYLKLILPHWQRIPGCVLLCHINFAPLGLSNLPSRGSYRTLMYHLHINRRGCTLVRFVNRILAYGAHVQPLAV